MNLYPKECVTDVLAFKRYTLVIFCQGGNFLSSVNLYRHFVVIAAVARPVEFIVKKDCAIPPRFYSSGILETCSGESFKSIEGARA